MTSAMRHRVGVAGFMIFVGGANDHDSWSNLTQIASSGVYAALMSTPTGFWRGPHEGTFADYASVEEGDAIFFFSRRKIYGIGRVVNVEGSCKFVNFPGGSEPIARTYESLQGTLLWDEGPISTDERWLCTFVPSPGIFNSGVDIDDVLSSDPQAFKSLRAMQSVSFARMDDRETQSLQDVILRANSEWLVDGEVTGGTFDDQSAAIHREMANLLTPGHLLDPRPVLDACAADDGRLKHEMALEAGLVWQLVEKESQTISAFGSWDYVTHQVLASPFKPLSWADRMDVFAYSFLPGFRPTRNRFLVVEAKKDSATIEVINQVMKYVDWVRDEYAGGDYSAISAYVVAFEFPDPVKEHALVGGRRIHTVGRRPAAVKEWNELVLMEYRYSEEDGRLVFAVA